MKEVTIEGVEYLPASALAKQFRYTTDYLGQLCRAKKVDARLVGRTWYINPLSLTKHKTARYKKVETAEKIPEIAQEITLSRTDIDPQIFIGKHQKLTANQQPHFARRIDWKPLKYETDEVELLPQISRHNETSKKIKLNLAESKPLSVKNNSKETKMVADELPTVSLKGKLKIESLNENFVDDIESSVPESVPELVLSETKILPSMPKNIASSPKKSTSVPSSLVRRPPVSNSPVSLIPTNLSRSRVSISTISEADSGSGRSVEVFLLTSTTILVACLFLLVFGELNLVAQPGFYEWEFVFSTQSLPALVSLFSQ